ncbi:MAG: 4Fe-4S binding protein [Methanomassiliicoccales archaeon]|nr:4Fe-4S binding protein [Methanomassiliicoccales archaeon]
MQMVVLETYKDLPSTPVTFYNTEGNKTGNWRTIRPVFDESKCTRCYICWKYCPDLSIEVETEGDFPKIDYDHCKGCGICANECPSEAIVMEKEAHK